MSFFSFGFTFEDLHTTEGLERLDQIFLNYLQQGDETLCLRLKEGRVASPPPIEESALLLDLAPYVEDFLARLFSIEKEISALQSHTYALAPLYRCKRLFVQRRAAKAFSKNEAQSFPGLHLKEILSGLMGEPFCDLNFAIHVLKALDDEEINKDFLEVALKYAAWSLYQDNPSVLFKLPLKVDPEALISLKKEGKCLVSPHKISRREFGVSTEDALDQVHYCILCHNQGKDSCSKGHSQTHKGCPLDQKISEMNTLRTQGYVLGALCMIIVDNPMVAATGHRICNDCMKACIFQKQEPVDIPKIETQTLESVLNLPWGVEIYGLLSRWNPLNLKRPYPKKSSGYNVLIAGMGPAGFTLAHYLLNEGHRVVGIDGLKIEPLEKELLIQPIRQWDKLKEPLQTRRSAGFGGVAEYGITARWDKNYLKLVRLLLERRSHFALYDGVRLGGTLTLPQAFELGFDHIALCLGSGKPNILDLPHGLARGIRLASDFLMTLQLTGAAQESSLANLQIRLPILVVGGGLTAVDTATEALAYYPLQVEKFLKRTEELVGLPPSLSQEEANIAEEFLNHARSFRQEDYRILENASTIVYRKRINDSPSYRLNSEELDLALQQGVVFLENATPRDIKVDEYGHIESLLIETHDGFESLPCRTLLIAIGTHANTVLEEEDSHLKIEGEDFLISYGGAKKVSFFGDLHPSYQGNVVKAMASAKGGYPHISKALAQRSPSPSPNLFKNLNHLLRPRVKTVRRLTPTIVEVIVKAPQAAQNFKPGQFFRLQNYGPQAMEGLALTGASADSKQGLLSLIILEMGGSSTLCQFLKPDEPVVLMGPTGTPTEIPKGETVLLIGGGLGNAVLFSIGRALKENNNRVLYVAGYKKLEDLFKREEIEAISDHVIWCSETSPQLIPHRPQDFSYKGSVIEGLLAYATSSPPLPLNEVNRIITIGSDYMMAAVTCARKTVLKPYLNPAHKAIGSINSPMQCMMKGICGQCIQTTIDSTTGQTKVIFSCSVQDQLLDEVDFEVLHNRLQHNSLLEKQTKLWGGRYIYDIMSDNTSLKRHPETRVAGTQDLLDKEIPKQVRDDSVGCEVLFMNRTSKSLWAIGLMSGTSADGIDAALIQTDGVTVTAFGPTHYAPYSPALSNKILAAYGKPPSSQEGHLEKEITELHADAVFTLLEKAGLNPSEVDLIGFHGQTLFHTPPHQKGEKGATHVIGDGRLLAHLTGISVVDQFRLNDVSQGGQGAPLVPIFHQALSKNLPKPVTIVNIGGVTNLTWIGAHEEELLAFDIGPGNGLIDDWVRDNTNLPWDEGGKIASKGTVNEALITQWLSHPYFAHTPPKSLDRKTFHLYLEDIKSLPFEDGVATLTAFTAASLAKAFEYLPQRPSLCLVAGGGAHNPTLLKMIRKRHDGPFQKTSDYGWDGDALEAQAFGFLAVRSLKNLPLTFPGTTGVPCPLTGGRVCRPPPSK